MTDRELTHAIIGAAIEVHRQLGPGLLESAYEECLARELTLRSIPFDRQQPLPVVYKGVKLECGYRLDFLVDGRIVVKLKAVEALAPIHDAILLTYLRLSGCKIGLLINFHCTVLKNGIRRRVLNYKSNEETHRGDAEGAEEKPGCQTAEFES
jgi:GxxExxY protein